MMLGTGFISYEMLGRCFRFIKMRREKLVQEREKKERFICDSIAALQKLTDALEKASAKVPDWEYLEVGIGQLPALVGGLEAMCKEFAKTVDTFQRSIDGSSYSTGNRGEDEQTEEEQEVRTLIRQGISEAEATARVREKNLYARMR